MGIYEKLLAIQGELKAPKNQYNAYGKFHYRSCEDILEALKPLLAKHNVVLLIEDEIVHVEGRFYVRASIHLQNIDTGESLDTEESIVSTSYAREDDHKTGMDAMQLTGAASTYARKYALNGLFLIDDTKDADTMDNREDTNEQKKAQPAQSQQKKGTPPPAAPPPARGEQQKSPQGGMEEIKEQVKAFEAQCDRLGLSKNERKSFRAYIFQKGRPTKAEIVWATENFDILYGSFIDNNGRRQEAS